MAFYYVKSGGTAVGDAGRSATQRTGTFAAMGASNYYDSVDDAYSATTSAVSGDFVCCSHLHAKQYTTTTVLSHPNGIYVISVDDANAENYLAGATEQTNNGDFSMANSAGGSASYRGMGWISEDNLFFTTAGSSHFCYDCTLNSGNTGPSSGDDIQIPTDGIYVFASNCIFSPSDVSAGSVIGLNSGALFEIYGGSLAPGFTNPTEYAARAIGGAGGHVIFDGFDFTNTETFQIFNAGSASADDNNKITLKNCKLPATWTLGEPPASSGTFYDLQNCDDGNNRSISAYRSRQGQFVTNNAVYDSGADQVEGQNTSLEIQTSSDAKISRPLRFKIGAVRADFSTSKTISVEVVHDALGSGTGSVFRNDEMFIEVNRPNSGDPSFLIEHSSPGDPFSTPSDNSSTSATWTGTSMTSETTEQLSLTTTTGGGEGWADVYVYLAVASIGLGDLFISPDIKVI